MVWYFLRRRMKNLEGSMTHLLESRQKRINVLEMTLKEVQEEKTQVQQKMELLKLKVRMNFYLFGPENGGTGERSLTFLPPRMSFVPGTALQFHFDKRKERKST